MKLKDGVRVYGTRPETVLAMGVMDSIYQTCGSPAYEDGVFITSVVDGVHSENSAHYGGCAFDCRIWFLSMTEVENIANEARTQLGPDYDVRVEKDHIHVAWKPRHLN